MPPGPPRPAGWSQEARRVSRRRQPCGARRKGAVSMAEQTLERTGFDPDEITFDVLEGDPYELF